MTTTIARPSVARDHCLAPTRVVDAPIYGGRYSRLFPDLPALECDESFLHALGAPGGLCDPAGQELPESTTAAGWPFFGQFVAHDITADRSPIADHADLEAVRNFRTPRANLEALYGGGPVGSPYLYMRDDPAKLLLGLGGRDVPRNQEGLALIGDPRNDVHLFVNQLHVLWLRVHNLLVDRLREDGTPEADVFEEARRAALWHYQWIVLHDFLPSAIGVGLTAALLDGGPRFYAPGESAIPLEFADAAYRYGHGQIRETYSVDGDLRLPLFPDLMGFQPVAHDLDWSTVFDLPGKPPAQRSRRLDGTLPQSLIHLPLQITGEVTEDAYHSLAVRDLQRGLATGLPSGEAVARAIGAEPLTPDEVGLGAHGWTSETPLWLYLLREADARADGNHLGPVGGRIVGEVLVGIIDSDPESYRTLDRGWRPSLFTPSPGESALGALIAAVSG